MEDPFAIDRAWLQRFDTSGRSLYTESYWNWLSHPTNSTYPWLVTRSYDEIRRTLAAGANVTEPDADGNIPFQQAYGEITTAKKYYVACVHPELVRVLTTCLGRAPTQMEIYGVATHKKTSKFRFNVKKRVDAIVAKFMEAARRGDLETMQRMVESDEIGVNTVDKSTGETALAAALASDNPHVCIFLMMREAHARGSCTVNGRKGSVLLAAVLTGDVKLVRQVAAHGGLPSGVGSACVFVEAVKMGEFMMIDTLLDIGVHIGHCGVPLPWPINRIDQFNLSSPRENDLWRLLFMACSFQDIELFQYLQRTHTELEDLMSIEKVGAAFLVLAVYQENEELVVALLGRGASVNRLVGAGINAMVAAVAVNSTRMLQLLLERGGDIALTYYTQSDSFSLLSMAVNTDAMDCFQMLLSLDMRSRCRVQAVIAAIKVGHMEMLDLLLAKEEDEPIPSPGFSFEMCLYATRCPLVLDSLLTRWCPSKISSTEMNRIFARLCNLNYDPPLLAIFLAHGVDLANFTANGDGSVTPPLVQGAMRSLKGLPAVPVVEFLLESGVSSLSVDSRSGRTPMQVMDNQLQGKHWAYISRKELRRKRFSECRDLFAANSSRYSAK